MKKLHKREDPMFFNAFKQNIIKQGGAVLIHDTVYMKSREGTMVRLRKQ